MRIIPPSELILNDDGSIFHLHVKPGQISKTIILVGDPSRVDQVSSYFSRVDFRVSNREFTTATGVYNGKSLSVVSTGIGTDNIDIVLNELDALFNIDFETRTEKKEKTTLTLVRLGTCGAIQPNLKIGDFIMSHISVGFDGLLNFYAGRDEVSDADFEAAFTEQVGWNPQLTKPYFVRCSRRLARLFADTTIPGMTVTAPGFYAPQGRQLRLAPADPELNDKIEKFEFQGRKFTNFEMEGSAIAGLSQLLGHEATTICTVIAQRIALDMQTDYKHFVNKMIVMSLEKLTGF